MVDLHLLFCGATLESGTRYVLLVAEIVGRREDNRGHQKALMPHRNTKAAPFGAALFANRTIPGAPVAFPDPAVTWAPVMGSSWRGPPGETPAWRPENVPSFLRAGSLPDFVG
jgi:hypothetical protein